MKNSLALFLLTGLLLGCSKPADPVNPNDPTLITPNPMGEWIAAQGGGGGFGNFDSFKNYQHNFDVGADNQPVLIGLTSSDINVQYALFNPLGQQMDVSSPGRNVSKPYTLNIGTYRVVVAADRRAVGKFTLSLTGTKAGAAKIPSQILQSDTQNWGKLGGGGSVKSFKNHLYTFAVTEDNTSIDFELESADTEVAMILYDELNVPVASQSGDRYEFQVKAVKKGTYTIMAGTSARGSVGNYALRIIGKVSNLQRIDSQSTTVTGSWADNKAADIYNVQVSKNSPLDIELSSPDVNVNVQLLSSNGDVLIPQYYTGYKTEVLVTPDLSAKTYRIQVRPYVNGKLGGNYTLAIHGLFTDFKKL